jgi:hypothetical protein
MRPLDSLFAYRVIPFDSLIANNPAIRRCKKFKLQASQSHKQLEPYICTLSNSELHHSRCIQRGWRSLYLVEEGAKHTLVICMQ